MDWSTVSALPERLDRSVHRRARVPHDRLRLRLGQRRRRLLPLPAAQRLDRAASSAGRRSAARSPPSSCWSPGCCSPARTPTCPPPSALDPIGALGTLLPTWFLVPFILVAVLGLIGGALLDIYSSGLSLLAPGLRVPRPVGRADRRHAHGASARSPSSSSPTDFIGPFQGFLITLGVPIAAWCGIMLADIALRKRDYAERRALRPARPLRQRPAGRRWRCSSSARCSAGAWSPTPTPAG